MNEEEKKAIEGLKKDLLIHECWEANNLDKIFKISHLHSLRVVLNLIEKQKVEIEKYKRLAEANLKDAEEFKNNMCEHRCLKQNEVIELKAEIDKKDKIIEAMAEEIHSIVNLGEFMDRKIDKLDTKEEIKNYFEKVGEE